MYERNIVALRKYFTHMSLAGVTWRFAGKINLVSDQFAEMLGYTKEEMVNRCARPSCAPLFGLPVRAIVFAAAFFIRA